MTRYADPERCPDCLARMPYGASSCPHCGLPLEGPLAAQLFATLSNADRLLAAMRKPAPVGATTATQTGRAEAAPPAPTGPSMRPSVGPAVPRGAGAERIPPAHRRLSLSGTSVPKILLGLGALCLLVAALVFLAVAWSAMGVGGRTATLVAFTALTGSLAAWAARRDLRAAAESLSVVALGLLAFDLVGARSAGWLGDVEAPTFLVELGAVLAVAGAGAGLTARRTPVRALRGAEVLAALGVACIAGGTTAADWFGLSVALTLAVVLAGAVAFGAQTMRLAALGWGAASVAVVGWWILLVSSWERAAAHPSLGQLWGEREVWPLLVAAALGGLPALVRRLPLAVRVGAAAVALVVLAAAVVAPLTDETTTAQAFAGAVLVLVVSLGGWFLPQPWRRSAGAVAGLGLLAMGVVGGVLVRDGLERIVAAATPPWARATGDPFPARVADASGLDAWLLPVVVLAGAGALVAVARSFGWADRVVAPLVDVYVVSAAAAATAVLTLALYPVPVWVATLALLASGAGLVAAALRRHHALPLALGAVFLAGALVLGLHDAWQSLLAAGGLLVLAGVVHLRWPRLEVSVAAGALASGATAGVVWTAGTLAEVRAEWTALATLLVLALLALGGPYVDERLRVSGPATYARLGAETGAFLAAAVVSAAALEPAPPSSQATWAAVYLTVVGTAASAMALLRPDRRLVGWLGGLLLAAASWVRLADLGVSTVEAYTLPSATALLVVGLAHLRRDVRAGTMAALSPGLLLALVPSLVQVVMDPTALRAVSLGAACLILVVGGSRLRWSAPVVDGALVGAALVVRYAVPLAQGVPQWLLIGAAGVVLIGVGITWEQRVRDAKRLVGYVRGLR